MTLTGNSTVDATILTAEATRQGVVNAAGVTQAAANTATIAYYRSVLAAKLSAGLDVGNEQRALTAQLGVTI